MVCFDGSFYDYGIRTNVMKMAYDPEIRNFVVRYETWEAYNVKSKEEAIAKAKADFGNDIEIIEVQ